ncbi:hypothetical protein F5Y12DRAFT_794843 [Xylaria sp. FL1777]|nr:hypothetical protein F5Y12DRAFT_794843 [Xylaria sp. FL1777]
MQRTPPLNLPPRPIMAVQTYKTLPDASKAGLPPKPVTPTSFSSTTFPYPRGILTPDPSPEAKAIYRCQKRKYSHSDDSINFPLQTTPTPKRTRYNDLNGHSYHSIDKGEVTGHATKTGPTSPNNAGTRNRTYDYHKAWNIRTMHKEIPYMSKQEQTLFDIRRLHNKLLGGATTITKKDQSFLGRQIGSNPANISGLMMKLIIKRVTNKTPDLSYAIMNWANMKGENQLLEDVLVDWLYNFDMEEAFHEGLMSVQEVSNLMDCQTVLECIRNKPTKKAREAKREYANTSVDAQYESDAGSLSMDLSDAD